MSKPRVFVTRRIPAPGQTLVEQATEATIWQSNVPPTVKELIEALEGKDGCVSFSGVPMTAEVIDSMKSVRVISHYGVGYDNVDVPAATRRGIIVCNTPEVLTDTVADLTIGLLIDIVRGITWGDRLVRANRWKEYRLLSDVYGHTLGLIGFGRIGQAVARRARAFDLRVYYHDQVRFPEAEKELGAEFLGLDELLAKCDFVSLHVSLDKASHRLIGDREFGLMKKTAFLINTSRGAVVDQAALVQALTSNTIVGAALDVFEKEPLPGDDPLIKLENVVLMPHAGSATVETRNKMAVLAAENLLAALNGERPKYVVNPEVLK